MSARPRKANAKVPSKLMAKRFADRFSRVDDVNCETAKFNAISACGDTIAKLVFVAEVARQGLESADFSQVPLGSRHHGAKHEIESAEMTSDNHARSEISAIDKCLKIGCA